MNEQQLIFSKEIEDLKGIIFVFDHEIINEELKKKIIDIINDLNGVSLFNLRKYHLILLIQDFMSQIIYNQTF